MIVVNADDFGLSPMVNRAISICFSENVISSTTIMANMPGFQEACEIAHDNGWVTQVGIHINLTEGLPLTEGIRKIQRFCGKDGNFIFNRSRHCLLTSSEQKVLASEVRAQIERCRKHGLPLSHADSHHHIHTALPVFAIFAPILNQHGIRNVRLSRNAHSMSFLKRSCKAFFNRWIKKHGFQSTDYFGSLADFLNFKRLGRLDSVSFEIMVHPICDDKGNVKDEHYFQNIDEIREILKGYRIQPYT